MKNFPNLTLTEHSILLKEISILRDKNTAPEVFRSSVSRIAMVLALEIFRGIKIDQFNVETPLEITKGYKFSEEVVLVPVLRAGLGMVPGFLTLLPEAKVGHIGIQRNEETLEPMVYYSKSPSGLVNAKTIVLDPMLATGGSASEAIAFLKKNGAKNICMACLVSAPEGVERLLADHPDVMIYSAVLDRQLNSKGYILPGLGDAGDRTFGTL